MYLASDSYALAPFTKDICFLEDGDRTVITKDSVEIFNQSGEKVERAIRKTAQSGLTTGKGDYRHFMEKEIFEQPAVISDTLNSFINPSTGDVSLPQDVLDALSSASALLSSPVGPHFMRVWWQNIGLNKWRAFHAKLISHPNSDTARRQCQRTE